MNADSLQLDSIQINEVSAPPLALRPCTVKSEKLELPVYYQEGVLSGDSLFARDTVTVAVKGMPGEQLPYKTYNDDVVNCVLFGCFFFILITIAHSKEFFVRQLKYFFRPPKEGTTVVSDTTSETRSQIVMLVVTVALISLLYYFYVLDRVAQTFILQSQYLLLPIIFAIFLGFVLLKGLLYTIVNNIFFDNKRNTTWIKTLVFLFEIEGLVLFLALVLYVYFDLPLDKALISFMSVVIFVKILTFYKCYNIFFGKIIDFLQIILYLCTLEVIPLLALWGSLTLLNTYLEINI